MLQQPRGSHCRIAHDACIGHLGEGGSQRQTNELAKLLCAEGRRMRVAVRGGGGRGRGRALAGWAGSPDEVRSSLNLTVVHGSHPYGHDDAVCHGAV